MRQIILQADRENAEKIGDLMMEAGAYSYTTEDADAGTDREKPLFGEPGLEPDVQAWDRSTLTILMDDGFDWRAALEAATPWRRSALNPCIPAIRARSCASKRLLN